MVGSVEHTVLGLGREGYPLSESTENKVIQGISEFWLDAPA